MSLTGEHFKSLEDVEKALDSTGFVYVSKNTEYDPVTKVLKYFSLKCERFGVFKSRAKTNKATTAGLDWEDFRIIIRILSLQKQKMWMQCYLHGTINTNDNGVVDYKITFHEEKHNHDKPSKVDSDAVTDGPTVHAAACAQSINRVAETWRENQTAMQKDNRAASSQEHGENYQVEAEVTWNDGNIQPLIRQIKNLYRELKVGHAQPGFKLIEKCVNDLQDYVDKSNSNDGVVTAVTAKKNDNMQQNDVQEQDNDKYEQVACNDHGADTFLSSLSKLDDSDDSFIPKSIDKGFPLENRKSLSKTESESDLEHRSEPQSDLERDIPAIGIKKVTFASQVKNTDAFKKVATTGRPKKERNTAIGLERRSMPTNWDRSPGQQVWSMLNWISLSKNVLQNVFHKEYKIQVEDLNRIKKWIFPFLNDRCDLNLIEDYFDESALKYLTSSMNEAKEADEDNVCQVCFKNIAPTATECDSCLLWFDTACVGRPDDDGRHIWFFPKCAEWK